MSHVENKDSVAIKSLFRNKQSLSFFFFFWVKVFILTKKRKKKKKKEI